MSGYRPDNGFSGLMKLVRQELKEAASGSTAKFSHPQNVVTNEEPQIDAEELGVEEYENEDLNKVPPQTAPVSKSKKDPRYSVRLVKDSEIENPAKTKLESKGDLYLCGNCFKTFRNVEDVCTECRSNIVEKVVQAGLQNEGLFGGKNYFIPSSSLEEKPGRLASIKKALSVAVEKGLLKGFQVSSAGISLKGVRDVKALNQALPIGVSIMRESMKEHEKGMANDYYVDQIVDVVKNIVKAQGNNEISLENLQTTIIEQVMDAVVYKLEMEGISIQ